MRTSIMGVTFIVGMSLALHGNAKVIHQLPTRTDARTWISQAGPSGLQSLVQQNILRKLATSPQGLERQITSVLRGAQLVETRDALINTIINGASTQSTVFVENASQFQVEKPAAYGHGSDQPEIYRTNSPSLKGVMLAPQSGHVGLDKAIEYAANDTVNVWHNGNPIGKDIPCNVWKSPRLSLQDGSNTREVQGRLVVPFKLNVPLQPGENWIELTMRNPKTGESTANGRYSGGKRVGKSGYDAGRAFCVIYDPNFKPTN